jgi:hypothetical protein
MAVAVRPASGDATAGQPPRHRALHVIQGVAILSVQDGTGVGRGLPAATLPPV